MTTVNSVIDEKKNTFKQALELTKKKVKNSKNKGFNSWIREYKAEFKRILWPSFKEVVRNTWIVFYYVFLCGSFIWTVDWLILKIFSFLIAK